MRRLIHGTFDNEDLIPAFANELNRMDTRDNQCWPEDYQWIELAAKSQRPWPHPYSNIWTHEAAMEARSWLEGQLDNRAATGEFFGPNPGNASDFGFWRIEKDDKPKLVAEVIDTLTAWAEHHESRARRLEDSMVEGDRNRASNYRVLIDKLERAQ
jgi:hypothetical protein